MFALIPPVFISEDTGGPNATHKLFWIVMYRNMPECSAAVLAQELREFWLKTWLLTVPGLLALALGGVALLRGWAGAGAPIAGFVVFCLLALLVKFPPLQRWLEIRGHETEVQAAVMLYGADEAEHLAREVGGMRRGYDGLFADVPVETIYARMYADKPRARRFVERHRATLQRFKQEVR